MLPSALSKLHDIFLRGHLNLSRALPSGTNIPTRSEAFFSVHAASGANFALKKKMKDREYRRAKSVPENPLARFTEPIGKHYLVRFTTFKTNNCADQMIKGLCIA